MEHGRDIAALSKERDYSAHSVVVNTSVIGDVRGKSVLIVDDIVDTAGSVVSAVRSLWERRSHRYRGCRSPHAAVGRGLGAAA